jgi:hypothetical protein
MSKRQTAVDRLVQKVDARIEALQWARDELLADRSTKAPIKKPRTLAAVAAGDSSK